MWEAEDDAKRQVRKEKQEWAGNQRLLHKHANTVINVQEKLRGTEIQCWESKAEKMDTNEKSTIFY